ncbi:hypothetical protein AN958_12342 [Leucoagaricus sp. SymC.cos]|nr:hypothetical protein AN958_12342 [Leucoagaricus sp. SymC.cos]
MDYLCHHCYTRTAVASMKDSMVRHLDADGDEILQPKDKGILADQDVLELSKETLMEAELRNRIRVKILFGEVDDAIDLLNEHFPSVLAPPTPSSKPSSYPSALEAMNSSKHLIPTTTDPRHLILNLRILGFTELCRAQPLVYSSPSLRTTEINMSDSTTSSHPSKVDVDGSIQTSQSPTSKMENMTRYMTVLWVLVNEMKIKARPGMVLPPVNPTQRTPMPPIQMKQVPEGNQV